MALPVSSDLPEFVYTIPRPRLMLTDRRYSLVRNKSEDEDLLSGPKEALSGVWNDNSSPKAQQNSQQTRSSESRSSDGGAVLRQVSAGWHVSVKWRSPATDAPMERRF
jgi:hypothetical protein